MWPAGRTLCATALEQNEFVALISVVFTKAFDCIKHWCRRCSYSTYLTMRSIGWLGISTTEALLPGYRWCHLASGRDQHIDNSGISYWTDIYPSQHLIPGAERVSGEYTGAWGGHMSMLGLGMVITSRLTMGEQPDHLIPSCVFSIIALRTLRSHGLRHRQLHLVAKA